jgi:hypothetical protein
LAVANYESANGVYPPAYENGPDGRPWHSWRVLILPYMEEHSLYNAYNFAQPWDGPYNRMLMPRMPRLYAFHGTDRPGNTVTNYLAVVGEETAWPGSNSASLDNVTDGPGQSIMLVENQGAGIHWMEPRDLAFATFDARLNSPTGISSPYQEPAVVTLDGQIQRLKLGITPDILRSLFTIRGGERLYHDGEGMWDVLQDGRLRPRLDPESPAGATPTN